MPICMKCDKDLADYMKMISSYIDWISKCCVK